MSAVLAVDGGARGALCAAISRGLVLTLLLVAHAAVADVADEINAIRAHGCAGRPGVEQPLRPSAALDAAAKEWSRGGSLRDALARAHYRMISSASMRVQGAADERKLLKLLVDNYCEVIVNPSFTEIGVRHLTGDIWIVVARPFTAPAPGESAAVSREVLALVNAARSQARQCGRLSFRPAAPLTLSPLLERAALAHAKDMTRHSRLQHRGSDGSEPADRVARTGYAWRAVGENIAAGAPDAKAVVQGWLDSPVHCANIMGPQFTQMGVAYAVDPKSEGGVYWAQVFAAPLR